ncbi:MAG: signal peptide peptidase SppA [Deltaproteobacteria bacterium]|nr:signal peptide peptidase SppA [Deltaproteobacteria bacterium]
MRLLSMAAAVFGLLLILTFSVSLIRILWETKSKNRPRVEVIELSGVIMSSTRILEELKQAEEDDQVKALVVHINSPGGMVAPSQEIYAALLRVDQKKPVIASMASLAASGGYYAALGARKIFANPGTLTASIGVIMEFANTQKLFQWAKIERFALKAGRFKDVGSPLREMSKEDRALLEGMLTNIHAQFSQAVKERRKLNDTELASTADGRVMTGEQAVQTKLVDTLGGIEEAISEAKTAASLPADAFVHFPSSKRGVLRKFFLGEDDPSEKSFLGSLGDVLSLASGHSRMSGARIWLLAPLR